MEPALVDYHNLVVEGERRGGTRGGIHCTAGSSGRIDGNWLLVEEDKTEEKRGFSIRPTKVEIHINQEVSAPVGRVLLSFRCITVL